MRHLNALPERLRVVLGIENGFVYQLFDSSNPPPLASLIAVAQDAWGTDYQDKAVFRYDRAYLDWLMPQGRFFGIWVTRASDGVPVGCELAIEREVFCRGRAYKGYYVTLLSVTAEHRGKGIAQRILHHLAEVALDRMGGEVIVSAFDGGAGGKPTVQKYVGGREEQAIVLSQPFSVWAAAFDLRQIDRYERLTGLSRIALLPGLRQLLEVRPRPSDLEVDAAPVAPSLAFGDPAARHEVGFSPVASIAQQYGEGREEEAGTIRYKFDRSQCALAYHIVHLTKPGLPDKPIGQIQLARAGTASPRELKRALRALNAKLRADGCMFTILLDTGILPRRSLLAAGFLPTPRKVQISVRGRQSVVNAFRGVRPNYFVDLL